MKEEPKDTIKITDLLDVVHYTVIKNKGENTIILHELQSIWQKITDKKLENYGVQGITFWEFIKNNLPAARRRRNIDIAWGILAGALIMTFVYIVMTV